MKGLYISGAKRSSPNKYIKPAFRVDLKIRLTGFPRVDVIVLIAVTAQRMFNAVNL
jgi:hypothetical protein